MAGAEDILFQVAPNIPYSTYYILCVPTCILCYFEASRKRIVGGSKYSQGLYLPFASLAFRTFGKTGLGHNSWCNGYG